MTGKAERKRPGRPPGTSDTRERILTNARELFARNGIDKTSIRAVAAAAGVDPALVHHYYGTKQQLFAAANEPKRFVAVPGGGHNDPPSREYLLALRAFLEGLPPG